MIRKKPGNQYNSPNKSLYSTNSVSNSTLSCTQNSTSLQPCNLISLKLTEQNGSPSNKDGTRQATFYPAPITRSTNQPNSKLQSGDIFQITAYSNLNEPRELIVEENYEGQCSKGIHPKTYFGSAVQNTAIHLHRKSFLDLMPAGLTAILQACYLGIRRADRYNVREISCGYPSNISVKAVSNLTANIEVYPADKFKFELQFPALFSPDFLEYEKKTRSWETKSERQEREEREEREKREKREDIDNLYIDFKKPNIEKEETPSFFSQTTASFTQTDKKIKTEFPISDIVTLIRTMRDAERTLKAVNEWVKNAQIGPGVSFSIECQFLVGTFSAEWGYQEHLDHRVFMGFKGAVNIDILKLNASISIGFKSAGLADLLLIISGEGTLSLEGSAERKEIDQLPSMQATSKGEVKLTGKVEGTLFWIVKGSVGIGVAIKAEVSDFKLFTKNVALGGKITLSRDPVLATFTVEGRFWGKKQYNAEVVKGDPKLGEFTFF